MSAKCVRVEKCREDLVPASLNDFNIQESHLVLF